MLLDWDDARAAFLRRVRSLGVAVKAVIVRAGPTTRAWEGETDGMDISCIDARALAEALARG